MKPAPDLEVNSCKYKSIQENIRWVKIKFNKVYLAAVGNCKKWLKIMTQASKG